jgi:hypothetical protein
MGMTNTKLETNLVMFGVPDIEEWTAEMVQSITYKHVGGYMVAAGLMSDAQELMAGGDTERARKALNVAKMVLFEIANGKLVGVVERAQ